MAKKLMIVAASSDWEDEARKALERGGIEVGDCYHGTDAAARAIESMDPDFYGCVLMNGVQLGYEGIDEERLASLRNRANSSGLGGLCVAREACGRGIPAVLADLGALPETIDLLRGFGVHIIQYTDFSGKTLVATCKRAMGVE